MKKQLIITTLFLLALVIGAANFSQESKPRNEQRFNVTIEQNGESQNIKNHSVVLLQETFDIIIELSEPMGLLVNASFNKKTFMLTSKNKPLEKLPGFQATGMAEGLLNSDKEVLLSHYAPNYWFYDSDEENRFNKVEKTENGLICTRTIESLFDTDTKMNIKVSDVDKPLYLVFISYQRGEKITDRIEVQRQCIKIEWK